MNSITKIKDEVSARADDDMLHRAVRQERINAEILKAVEMLGDRLARSERRRAELEEKVAQLESRPRALINLPVLRAPAAPPKVIAGQPPMSLGRLALVAGVSAFIVTAGFGLGILYGQKRLGPGLGAGSLFASQDVATVIATGSHSDMADSPEKPDGSALKAPRSVPLVAAVADMNELGNDDPLPFASGAVLDEDILSMPPGVSLEPAVDHVAERTQPVIRMGAPKPVEQPAESVTTEKQPVSEPAAVVDNVADVDDDATEASNTLPEVDVAVVRTVEPIDHERSIDGEPSDDAGQVVEKSVENTAVTPGGVTSDEMHLTPAADDADIEQAAVSMARPDPASLKPEKFAKPKPDKSLPEKIAKIEQRAYDGLAEAQHDLATFYVSGQEGVDVDFQRAAYWFQQAAESGVANAAYNLGVMYQQGLGIGPNVDLALKWYIEAAQLGHPEAQYNLGVAYAEGQGVEPNMLRAVSFFEKAAEQGVSPAAFNLGLIYENGLLGSVDNNKAAEWYKQAALMGHEEARIAWERLTGDNFSDMMAAISAGEAAAANRVEPAAGNAHSPRRAPERAEIDVMDRDAHRTLIRQVQEELIKRGLIPGPADGVETPMLSDAISAWQRQNGYEITGTADRDLLYRLRQN